MIIRRAILTSAIQLAENGDVPDRVQVLRVGKFSHPKYGEFEVTRAVLAEMVQNFDARVRGQEIAFDYFHDSDKEASGWPKQLTLMEGGDELWAEGVEWTPRARKMLAEKEVKYFSPDFAFRWKDPETGKVFNNVLFGGALTNRPFIKEMSAIVAAEEKETMDRIKELEAANLKLSEQVAAMEPKVKAAEDAGSKIAALEADIKAKMDELAKLKGENEAMLAEKKKLEEQVQCAEKEREFNVLLSEGKAVAAQKDAFMKGDMKAFVANASKVNLNPAGSGGGTGETVGDDAKVLKLAEEKRKADPKLDVGTSISLALDELAKK